jgi:hypothetical protein
VLAVLVTGAYTLRYVLPCVIGLSILFARAVQKLDDRSGRSSAMVFLLLCACGMFLQFRTVRELNRGGHHDNARTFSFLQKHAPGGRVVIADPHKFLELSHYRKNSDVLLSYVSDADLAVKHINVDTVDRGLVQMKQWAHLDVWSIEDLDKRRPLLIYSRPWPFGWLVNELAARRESVRLIAQQGDFSLYLLD